MNVAKFILLGSVVVFLAACGVDDSKDAALFNGQSTHRPLLIVSGGWNSCGHNPFGDRTALTMASSSLQEKLVNEIKERFGVTLLRVVSCFTSSRQFRFSTSDQPENSIDDDEDMTEYLATLDHYIGKATHVYWMGHSYGGWLVMKLASGRYNGLSTLKNFITIDPISKAECWWTHPFNCRGAPSDIDSPSRQQIRSISDRWDQYYQTRTVVLHSSPIDEAHTNEKLSFQHWNIDSAPIIWEHLTQKIEKEL